MSEPTAVRKLPVAVEAMLWPGGAEAATPVIDWVLSQAGTARYHGPETEQSYDEPDQTVTRDPEHIVIETLEGTMRAEVGDWIVRGVKGEFYPCKPDVFAETYEVIEPPSRFEARARAEAEARFITAAGGKPPTEEQRAAVTGIRDLVVELATKVMLDVPNTRDREIALEELETFHMRANRAIFQRRKLAVGGYFDGGPVVGMARGGAESTAELAQRISRSLGANVQVNP